MHKLECSAMCSYGENWCPSETVRLVARIIVKQVGMARVTDFVNETTSSLFVIHGVALASQANICNDGNNN